MGPWWMNYKQMMEWWPSGTGQFEWELGHKWQARVNHVEKNKHLLSEKQALREKIVGMEAQQEGIQKKANNLMSKKSSSP